MRRGLSLGYISIACDAITFGILINFIFGTETTLTLTKVYTLLIILVIGMIAKASSDIHSSK